eukprot:33331_1
MAQQQNELFTLTVRAGTRRMRLNGINQNMTIGEVKELYLDEQGLYHEGISKMSFMCRGKRLNDDNKTLKCYGITNGISPLTVVFKVCGGVQQQNELFTLTVRAGTRSMRLNGITNGIS